ncbi:hypothetical protein NL108_014776 [Boleophthalmus pectinirostris]|nr:hypothetical protein NL108_014776 [Boleophthalmus pectinirostris]
MDLYCRYCINLNATHSHTLQVLYYTKFILVSFKKHTRSCVLFHSDMFEQPFIISLSTSPKHVSFHLVMSCSGSFKVNSYFLLARLAPPSASTQFHFSSATRSGIGIH